MNEDPPVPDELVEFLLDRITADEMLATAATQGNRSYPRWTAEPNQRLEQGCRCMSCWEDADGWDVMPIDGPDCSDHDNCFHTIHIGEADALHIARHDPVRVLAESDARRRIVGRYQSLIGKRQDGDLDERVALRWVLELMAYAYAGHPDYQERWRR